MDWQQIYDRTVSHNLPRQGAYGALLRSFVLANRAAITTWIAEARAMLRGSGTMRSQEDLAMLAAMVERGCLAMLPAAGIADLVVKSIGSDARHMLVSELSFDRLEAMLPLSYDDARDLSRLLAVRVTRHVIYAVDALNAMAANLSDAPGARIDITGNEHRARLEPVCIMAAFVVMPFLPLDDASRDMTVRLAA